MTIPRVLLVPIGTLCIIIAFPVLNYFLSNKLLLIAASHKDAIQVIYQIFTMFIVLITSYYSYYRFFRGRTFSPRLEVKISATVHETTLSYNIHAVNVEVKNIGAIPLWGPRVTILYKTYGPDEVSAVKIMSRWWSASNDSYTEPRISVIECNEASVYSNIEYVDKKIWAVTYLAMIKSSTNKIWESCVTISNVTKAN